MKLKIKLLSDHIPVLLDEDGETNLNPPEAYIPKQQTPGAAAFDLYANVNRVALLPGERKLISTGISVAIPEGFCGLVLPRSGLTLTAGLGVANSPGLIDSDYRGEVCVVAHNMTETETVVIERGMRIAQLLLLQTPEIELHVVDELNETERNEGGFGSTGVKDTEQDTSDETEES